MSEISPEVIRQLERSQADIDLALEAQGPPVTADVAAQVSTEPVFGAAGSGTAKHILVDHYFTSSARRLWAHAGGEWRHHNVGNVEEQGIAQVAFAADRVDVWWNASNVVTLIRCWKNF